MTKRPVIQLRNIVMYLIYPVQQGVMDLMARQEVAVLELGIQMVLLEIHDSSINGIMVDTISHRMVCKCHKVLQPPKDTLAITIAMGIIMFISNLLTLNSPGTSRLYQVLEYQLRVEQRHQDQTPHLRLACNKLATLRQLSQILSTIHLIAAKWLHNKQRHHWRSRVH